MTICAPLPAAEPDQSDLGHWMEPWPIGVWPRACVTPASTTALRDARRRPLLSRDEESVVANLLPAACQAQRHLASRRAAEPGDLRSRDRLFVVLQPVLWDFAGKHSVPGSSRPDFVQDLNVLILEALPVFHCEPGVARFTTWLYVAAKHHATDLWRRRFARRRVRYLRPEDALVTDDGNHNPLVRLDREENCQRTTAALHELCAQSPQNGYRALHLRMIERLPVQDIAGILQTTPHQVSSWVHRAAGRLRVKLREKQGPLWRGDENFPKVSDEI